MSHTACSAVYSINKNLKGQVALGNKNILRIENGSLGFIETLHSQ